MLGDQPWPHFLHLKITRRSSSHTTFTLSSLAGLNMFLAIISLLLITNVNHSCGTSCGLAANRFETIRPLRSNKQSQLLPLHTPLQTWYVGFADAALSNSAKQRRVTGAPNVSSASGRLHAFSIGLAGFGPPLSDTSPKSVKSAASVRLSFSADTLGELG